MIKTIVLLALLPLAACMLQGCSQQQQTAAVTDISAVCEDIPIAEAADPTFVTHNPTLVTDMNKICAAVPSPATP